MWHASGSFGELLRDHRRRAGLTQQELSRRAGVSVRAVRDIEQGRVRRPRQESVERLATVVGLDPAEAATATNGPAPDPGGRRPAAAPAGAPHLHIGVLGPLTVQRSLPPNAGPLMQRTLLGLLAVQPNQLVGHEEIIDTLWGEQPPPSCHSLVRAYVARLRKLLEPARSRAAPARVLVTAGGGYVLTVDDGALDLLRFDGLAAAARKAHVDNPGLALELYGQALACWRGPVLADLPPRLRQHPAAVAASQRRVATALAFADLAIGRGQHQQAAERLRALASEEPLHEGLHARLILALAGDGQQAAALAVFTRLRDQLTEELGLEPGAELQDAQARVLQGDLPAIRPPDRQATGPALPPAQLPADVAGFTGRASHLAQLDALLDTGGEQPSTAVVITAIAGTAGVGKTALAVHWAHRVADRFPDGQLYVNLQGYAPEPPLEPLQALAGLLRALGTAPEEIPTDLGQAAGLYRSLLAGRRALVVLDNARSAEQVRHLLPGSHGCLVTVTSRDRLTGLVATHGVHRLTLDALTPAESVTLLGRVLGERRVAAEPAAAQELAVVCGGLPLALRIAAANLAGQPERSIAGYVAELRSGDRLAGLAVAGDARAAVRVAFDASYRRLTPDAQRMYRLLGLAPGPHTSVPAAAALAGIPPEQAARLLNALVDAHLAEPRGVGRVGLHDLLRLYARQRAQHQDSPAERAAAIRRLLDTYLHATDIAAGLLYPEMVRLPAPRASAANSQPPAGIASHADAMAWLDAERANLVAAVQHAAAEPALRRLAWLLTDSLRGYFWMRGHAPDWLTVAQAGLTAARSAGDVRGQAAAQLSLGDAHERTGNHTQAIEHYTRAVALARQAGWVDGQAASLGNLGNLHQEQGNLQEAADHHAQALALNCQTGRLGGQATALVNLGDAAEKLGRLREAADHQVQALSLFRRLGARDGEAFALYNLGETCRGLGRFADAEQHLDRALTILRELGDRNGQTGALRALAAVHRDAGRHAQALQHAEAATALAGEIGDRSEEASARNTLASIHLRGDRPRQAAEGYRQALELAREVGARVAEVGALLGLAAIHQHTGQPTQAIDLARQARTLATRSGFQLLQGQAATTLATVHQALGHSGAAIDHAEQALQLHRQTGYRLGQARTLHVLGSALRDTGDPQTAARRWQEALELYTDLGDPHSPEAIELRKQLDA